MNKLEGGLLSDLGKGDINAFNVIFKTYYTSLCFYANDFVNDSNFSREIVQDVFVKLWENHTSIHITSSLKAYLYRMVYNKCIDFLKHQSEIKARKVQLDNINSQIELLLAKDTSEPFDVIYSEQIETELENAICQLPAQCREVFIMSRHKKLSYPQIADKLNISVSSVKSQIKRAMNKLVSALDNYLEK